MTVLFYSFKGGVGRTMMLAEVAALLARHAGLKVLAVDFDLEAPGLEFYFQTQFGAAWDELDTQPGLLDYLAQVSDDLENLPTSKFLEKYGGDSLEVLKQFTRPVNLVSSGIEAQAGFQGCLDLMRAASKWRDSASENSASDYPDRLRNFDWRMLSQKNAPALQWLKRALNETYDIVLIDGRTGVTEIGSLASRYLADNFVVPVATNLNNVAGTGVSMSMIRNLHSSSESQVPRLCLVPTRVPLIEEQNEASMHRWLKAFYKLVSDISSRKNFKVSTACIENRVGDQVKGVPQVGRQAGVEGVLCLDMPESNGSADDSGAGLIRGRTMLLLDSYVEIADELLRWLQNEKRIPATKEFQKSKKALLGLWLHDQSDGEKSGGGHAVRQTALEQPSAQQKSLGNQPGRHRKSGNAAKEETNSAPPTFECTPLVFNYGLEDQFAAQVLGFTRELFSNLQHETKNLQIEPHHPPDTYFVGVVNILYVSEQLLQWLATAEGVRWAAQIQAYGDLISDEAATPRSRWLAFVDPNLSNAADLAGLLRLFGLGCMSFRFMPLYKYFIRDIVACLCEAGLPPAELNRMPPLGPHGGRLVILDDMAPERVESLLGQWRSKIDFENTTGSAEKWWKAFEQENKNRKHLVLRLMDELVVRKANITEFFLAYVYSNTDNIQANLHYLDYTRLKKVEEAQKKEQAKAKRLEAEKKKAGELASVILRSRNSASLSVQNSDLELIEQHPPTEWNDRDRKRLQEKMRVIKQNLEAAQRRAQRERNRAIHATARVETDEALTFIRCPSCRSLVPAVSKKCRMCGASLQPAEDN